MQYNLAIDPVDDKTIVVFSCTVWYLPKNGFAVVKYCPGSGYYQGLEYYQGNNTWLCFRGYKTAMVYDTQEEAILACTQYFDFLKECGYAV